MTISGGVKHEISAEGNVGVATFTQDQTTDVVDLIFHRNLATVTLSADTAIDDLTIGLEAGHGFSVGESICLLEGQNFSQFIVLAVVSDDITIDSPMDMVYTPNATTIRHTFDMRVDGSSTSQVYQIMPIAGQKWDITRIILVMESTANGMDFTGFGSLGALANGCIVRVKNGDNKNLFNFKTNGDFINRSFSHAFQAKIGGGGSGFTARSTFAGQNQRGVTIRLDGDKGDALEVVVQDAISAAGTLTKFEMIAQGHVVQ